MRFRALKLSFRTLILSAFLPALFLGFLTTGAARAEVARGEDVCLGNDTPGPFGLSWNHVAAGSERVSINGLAQLRGLDYTLDADGGTVTFTRNLPSRSAASISYAYDSGAARWAGGGQSVPLTVDLVRSDRGSLSFLALGKTGEAARSNLTVGVGLGWHPNSTASVATHFYFAPMTVSADGSSLPAEKRTGMSVSGSAGAGEWGLFSFGFARAGVSLGETGDGGLSAGRQNLNLSSRFTAGQTLTALVSYAQNKASDDTSAPATERMAVALTLKPSEQLQMSANLARNDTTGDAASAVQTIDLSVSAQPSAKMQVSATYSGKDAFGTAGDSAAIALQSVLTPNRNISLETWAGQSKRGGLTTNSQSVGLSLSPGSTLRFQAGLALRQREETGKERLGLSVASISATARPLSFLEFSGSYRSRAASEGDLNSNDQSDSSTARVSLSPLPFVHLVGTYAQNPDDMNFSSVNAADASVSSLQHLARRGVSLETSLGGLGLSGGCDWSQGYDASAAVQTVHADLGLRFSAATKLSVGYLCRQNTVDTSAPLSTAYTVGFTHALGDRFSLSLNGKSVKSAATVSPDYNASANLGMKF